MKKQKIYEVVSKKTGNRFFFGTKPQCEQYIMAGWCHLNEAQRKANMKIVRYKGEGK